MYESFKKLSTLTNLFREARMPGMAGPETPQEAPDNANPKAEVSTNPDDLAQRTKERAGKDLQDTIARLPKNLPSLEERAEKVKLTRPEAVRAMTELTHLLANRGPETNLREDSYTKISKTINKALNQLGNRDKLLAMLHLINEKYKREAKGKTAETVKIGDTEMPIQKGYEKDMSTEKGRLVASVLNQLTTDFQGNTQLMAMLYGPEDMPATVADSRKQRK